MTYEDILKQIQSSGQSWSQWDLDTAKRYPEFGASMLSHKSDWYSAKDAAGKTAANQAAEALRRQYGNYQGGSDGSKYYGLGTSPGGYQSGYQSRISEILDKMGNYGDFSYGAAPTYTNRYSAMLDELMGKVRDYGPFSWSKESDPSYSAYAKQYRREGQRATADAMAQAAAMTGGNVSSAAMTAAGQAGDYYAAQLADKVPELYQNAYQRYLSEYSMLADRLNQAQQAEQYDYAKYLDQLGQYNTDRSLSYDQWLQKYNMLGGSLSALQGQDQTEYQRYLDMVNYNQDQKNLYQQQVDAILSAGGTPTDSLVSQSGYGQEYVNALRDYYRQQAAKTGGGSRSQKTDEADGIPPVGTNDWYAHIVEKARETGQSISDYLYSNRSALGLTTGWIAEYASRIEDWQAQQGGSAEEESSLSPAARSILESYRHINPGTRANVPRVFGDRITNALNQEIITEREAGYLMRMMGY